MRARKLDVLLLHHLPSIRHLTGFTGSNALLCVTPRGGVLATDSRYATQVRDEVSGWRILVPADGLLTEALRRSLRGTPPARIGLEYARVTHQQYRHVRSLFAGASFVDVSGMPDRLRSIKSDDEIAAIRAAAGIADEVFVSLLDWLRPGMREREIAAEISYRLRLHGAERDSFEPIVVSGPRSALVHGQPSERALRACDPLLLDFGCVVRGYASDITRTISVGRARPAMRRMHAAVLDAQRAAIDAVQAGVDTRDVDAAARTVLDTRGYGEYFSHALGHGLGLEVHELPRLSRLSPGTLETGMVFTVEPGVYIPGKGGVRIEDDVLLAPDGAELLTQAPRALIEL